MFLLFVTAVALLVFYLIYVDVRKPHGYPDGPLWLPLVGNYTHFAKKLRKLGYFHLVWKEFANEYGNLIGLKLGKHLVVAVNGAEMIREVLTREEFMGRPDGFFFKFRTFGKQIGVVFSEGKFWEIQRKFTLQNLKCLGLGRQQMETIVLEEAHQLVCHLRPQCKYGAIEMKYAFDISVINTLWTLTAGKRYNLEDTKLKELVNLVHEVFTAVDPSGGILNQMPFLRHIIPDLCGFTTVAKVTENIYNFLRETVREHEDTFTSNAPRDLIDMFIEKMRNHDETFTEEQLLSLCMDLFMAGSETTSNTLAFFVLYMAEYPAVQKKIQKELDEILGSNSVTLQDKTRLPYTEATLLEVQRIVNVAPVGIPHKTTRDAEIQGCIIPKGTVIITNLYSIHMDPKLWGDPKQFRPERFLGQDGRLAVPEKHFLPFGFGKRRCLGESLAKTNYFIFICFLLQNFTFSKDPDHQHLDLVGRDGFTLTPKSAKLIVTLR